MYISCFNNDFSVENTGGGAFFCFNFRKVCIFATVLALLRFYESFCKNFIEKL
jgi:hypothetical protein